MNELWTVIMDDYENMAHHEKFIQVALDTEQMQFASQQYRGILDGNPNDEIAKKMRDRIIGLTMATYTPPRSEEVRSFRLGISGSLAVFGAILMVLGTVLEELPRTVTLVGAGLVVIGGAAMYFRSRNKKTL